MAKAVTSRVGSGDRAFQIFPTFDGASHQLLNSASQKASKARNFSQGELPHSKDFYPGTDFLHHKHNFHISGLMISCTLKD